MTASLGSSLAVVVDRALAPGVVEGVDPIRTRIAGPLNLQKLIQDQQASGLIVSPDSSLVRQGLAAGWLENVDAPLLVLRD